MKWPSFSVALILLCLDSSFLKQCTVTAAEPDFPFRIWTLDDGRTTESALVGVDDAGVRLQSRTGRIATVPLKRLSKADQEYVKGIADPAKRGIELKCSQSLLVLLRPDSGLWMFDREIGRTGPGGRDPVRIPPGVEWSVRPVGQTDETLERLSRASEQQAIPGICLRQAKITDAGLKHLKHVRGLRYLRLMHCKEITDAGLAHIRQIPELETLEIFDGYGCISDQGLGHLKGHPNLKAVMIGSKAKITTEGLGHLQHLPALRSLDLKALDGVTDDSLSTLGPLRQLRQLRIDACPKVNGSGLRALANTGLNSLDLWDLKLDEHGLEGLRSLRGLVHLDLYNSNLAKVDASPLAELVDLEDLRLTHSKANDVTLGHVAKLSKLTSLRVEGCDITDAGMASLQSLHRLQTVRLSGSVTPAGLSHLSKCIALKELTGVPDAAWNDASMTSLAGLSALETLEVGGTVTDAGLAVVGRMAALKKLTLSSPKITDGGLAHLKGNTSLECLQFRNSKITGVGLLALAGLPGLTELDVHSGEIQDGLSGVSRVRVLRLTSGKNVDSALKNVQDMSSLRSRA